VSHPNNSALFQTWPLWKATLHQSAGNSKVSKATIAKLREEFLSLRSKAEAISARTREFLPQFTLHDITHLDELWYTASLLASNQRLTPLEAFIFGCGAMVHDLGLSFAAFPNGAAELIASDIWSDIVTTQLKYSLGRLPFSHEVAAVNPSGPDSSLYRSALGEYLRLTHADTVRTLLTTSHSFNNVQYHLLREEFLQHLAEPIAAVASAHRKPIREYEGLFRQVLTEPTFLPESGTCDLLKVACLLRLADSAHVYGNRASDFEAALTRPTGLALEHWAAQNRMGRPTLKGSQLLYTAASRFPIVESDAWWRAYDLLATLDEELQQIDTLLADIKGDRSRFAATSVAYMGIPKLLAERSLGTSGWIPIDTKLHVSDVASLVGRLGGTQLYGDNPSVPIRELIQNGADAVRARRALDRHKHTKLLNNTGACLETSHGSANSELPDNHGDYYVSCRIVEMPGEHWLEVEDSGIGMTESVLTGPFLDFGVSYWSSSLQLQQFSNLVSLGFQPSGKYGIGFFSIFMIGTQVEVFTKSILTQSTLKLTFLELSRRPTLSSVHAADDPMKGVGTLVRVKLKHAPFSQNGILRDRRSRRGYSSPGVIPFSELLSWLCPALDVNLLWQWRSHIPANSHQTTSVIGGSDWKYLENKELASRLDLGMSEQTIECIGPIYEYGSGKLIGRAVYDVHSSGSFMGFGHQGGCVCVSNGFRIDSLNVEMLGLIEGKVSSATRDRSQDAFTDVDMVRWANDQLASWNLISDKPHWKLTLAMATIGGDVKGLAWGTAEGYNIDDDVSIEELARLLQSRGSILLLDYGALESLSEDLEKDEMCSIEVPDDYVDLDLGFTSRLPKKTFEFREIENEIGTRFPDQSFGSALPATILLLAKEMGLEPKEILEQSDLFLDGQEVGAFITITDSDHYEKIRSRSVHRLSFDNTPHWRDD
jgi:hypothetical protein